MTPRCVRQSTPQSLRHWRSYVNSIPSRVLPRRRQKRRAPSFPKAPFIVSMAISRILSALIAQQSARRMIIHLGPSCSRNAQSRQISTQRGATIPEDFIGPAALPLFCLAPHGVFRASRIAPRAVSSYLAFSPLPALFSKNRRCVFCDTLRRCPLSRMLPAYFTRHAAVWCSDFPPANTAEAGLTSDHLPSTIILSQSGKHEDRNKKSGGHQESRSCNQLIS